MHSQQYLFKLSVNFIAVNRYLTIQETLWQFITMSSKVQPLAPLLSKLICSCPHNYQLQQDLNLSDFLNSNIVVT